ncbi:Cell division protein DedD (protein involved in septation) [Yoonia tamlensis]|uniref:Cell division protein DedD (Protein involved in septation) n=1 Tax=Yoonia tamlensis TaxID=390270 RepID=A0A1I6GKU7_9RHOB|nr:SPOR domain-containing protein [Yoonia tamlensis]SFR42808.1 Cell division protein DedD (protein involved in septation) [Yoonia tamlensis]
MTGSFFKIGHRAPFGIMLVAALGLAACEEGGDGIFGARGDTAAAPATADASRVVRGDRDVERPDIFDVTDRGLWDGRPSLGGIWVAHPDVQDPERVIIRNPANGQSIVGALFRRERENPGPLLQVSSDAAESLGLLAGAPTELSVIALRREEIDVAQEPQEVAEDPADNAVVASLAAPVTVAATALDAAPAADPIASAAAAIAEVEAAESAAVSVTALDGGAAATTAAVSAPIAQIGVFSVEVNANNAAQSIRAAGIPAAVEPQDAGGRTVWRVVAGPVPDDATLAQLKSLGFVDAFVLEAAE